MNLLSLFRRRPDGRCEPRDDIAKAASLLGKAGAEARKERQRAKIRAKADEMRAAMGQAPLQWGKL